MIRYKCSGCGAGLESDDTLAGGKDRCPQCGARVEVPHTRKSHQAAADAAAKETARKIAAEMVTLEAVPVDEEAARILAAEKVRAVTAAKTEELTRKEAARRQAWPGRGVSAACNALGGVGIVVGALCTIVGAFTEDPRTVALGLGTFFWCVVPFGITALLQSTGRTMIAAEETAKLLRENHVRRL
jgi:DNA-directed RNA polymerase subunit RPC12/RpoP